MSLEERLAWWCMRTLMVTEEGQHGQSRSLTPQGALVTLCDVHIFTYTHLLPYSWIALLPEVRGLGSVTIGCLRHKHIHGLCSRWLLRPYTLLAAPPHH